MINKIILFVKAIKWVLKIINYVFKKTNYKKDNKILELKGFNLIIKVMLIIIILKC